ncbi:hypothetical protein BYT27DRAFT_7090613 [Phlegmacium glaucopus]|nr:hypothetical protein BYT27DRAFT_7090613 [Phlegmacium glaucopus]
MVFSSSVVRNTRQRKWKFIPPPLNLVSIEEERVLSEYDCGYLDLGAETPASVSTFNLLESSGLVENHIRARRPSLSSSPIAKNPNRFNKYAAGRDCGICFEYAVVPCRTLCCGKIFCTEHLADWLHGPKAEGRCPNCENACSLEGGTLSLASPPLHSSSQGKRNTLPQASRSTPLTTLTNSRDQLLRPPAATTSTKNLSASPAGSVTETLSTCSSTVDYSDTTTVCSEESKTIKEQQSHVHHSFSKEEPLTSSFSPPWGVVSRLISIAIFLMFLYKLQS